MTEDPRFSPRLPRIEQSAALLIGVSHFDHPDLAPLPSVSGNLTALNRLLTEEGHGGFAEGRCKTLPDPGGWETIAKAIMNLAETVTDTLVIYYAGHGLVDAKDELVLSTTASDPGGFPHWGMEYRTLREIMNDHRLARIDHRVVILDCCFSGRAVSSMGGKQFAARTSIAGTVVITATPPTSRALAPPEERYTTFTGTLLRFLDKGVAPGDEFLTLEDLHTAVDSHLAERSQPRPEISTRNKTGKIALTRNRAFAPVPAEPTPDATHQPATAGRHAAHEPTAQPEPLPQPESLLQPEQPEQPEPTPQAEPADRSELAGPARGLDPPGLLLAVVLGVIAAVVVHPFARTVWWTVVAVFGSAVLAYLTRWWMGPAPAAGRPDETS